MASGQNWDCEGNAPAYYCTTSLLELPPGIGKLDGTNWGGLKRDDLVIGYVFFPPFGMGTVTDVCAVR